MTHDNIFIILCLPEKWKILSDSHSKNISQLADKWTKFKYTFTEESCLAALFFWSFGDNKCCELQAWILVGLILVDGQVESVCWKDGIADCGRDVGTALFAITIKL